MVKLFAAARGNVRQLRLPETKYPLEARLVQRDGTLYVVLAVPGAHHQVDDLVAWPLTLTGTLIAHNNGLFYLVTAQGVSVPLRVERYGAALRLLAGHEVQVRGNYAAGGYFEVSEVELREENVDDDDDA